MKILVFATAFPPMTKAGGPARSLANLARELADDHELVVISPDRDLEDSHAFRDDVREASHIPGVEVIFVRDRWGGSSAKALWGLRHHTFDIALLNGMWSISMSLVPAIALSAGVVRSRLVIFMPRGELGAGALAVKSRKKQVAMPMYKAIFRRAIDAIGVTSSDEAQSSARWFPGKAVLTTTNREDEMSFVAHRPSSPPGSPALQLVFISRVSPKKGLLELLTALAEVQSPMRVAIYGPTDDGPYWRACQRQMNRCAPCVSVAYLGSATRDEVPGILSSADAMVLPTAHENFGHVIAEALQVGTPAIVTTATPWTPYLRAAGLPMMLDRTDSQELATILDDVAAWDDQKREEMRALARSAYDSYRGTRAPNVVEAAVTAGLVAGREADAAVPLP